MSESSSTPRRDDPLTDARDPLTATTDSYAATDSYPATDTYPSTGAYASPEIATTTTGGSSGPPSTKDTAKDQAGRVGDEARSSGAHVAGVAKDQAAGVAQEAKGQARDLLGQGRTELSSQATQQQQRAAGGLRGIGDQLGGLASGSPQPGLATDLAQQASEQVSKAAQWLESREPADLLREVQRFARRRPGAFLGIAAGVGLVAGRLTRGVAANAHDQHEADDARATRRDPYAADGYPGDGSAAGQYATGPYAAEQDAADPYATPVPYGESDPYARTAPGGSLPPTSTGTDDLGYATGPTRTTP